MKKCGYPTRTQEDAWTAVETAVQEKTSMSELHWLIDEYYLEQTTPKKKRNEK